MAKGKRLPREIVKSDYGSVAVYTRRHINGCELRDTNNCRCKCPKWLYVKPKESKAVQKAAETSSFAEACEKARKILDGFHPEIAEHRKVTEAEPGITIERCLELYEQALKLPSRSLSPKYIRNCLLPFNRRDPKEYKNGRAKNLSLLDFLNRANLTARDPVVRMEQITSVHLDEWAAAWKTNDLSTHTWRGVVATFFRWARLHDHVVRQPEFREPHRVRPGNRCGHLTDDQIEKMRQSLPFFRTKYHALPENYVARLNAFLDAGRWAGMAVIDIVNFSPRVSLGSNDVLTYRRKKSGQIATIAMDPAVAARLRSIPPEHGSDPEKPFRFPGTAQTGNYRLWWERFKGLATFAGITAVETEIGTLRKPHPHQLRDSFAIDAIVRGVRLENIARMLGHATTVMTQRSYLFWVQKRIDHCVEDQRMALARRTQTAPEPEKPKTDDAPRLIN